jgi:hypothetical protein
MNYKHTQIGYLTIFATVAVFGLFSWIQMMARAEPPSVNSGSNLLVTAIMVFVLLLLVSFWTLNAEITQEKVLIKFGYGFVRKSFNLSDVVSAKSVKNKWYFGWGVRRWFWPKMWIYNVSGFDAVEIVLKNGNIYRIGTDEPEKLERAILSKN